MAPLSNHKISVKQKYQKCQTLMAESYVYTLLWELCYLTEGQFVTIKLLKQSTNSGAYDSEKKTEMILKGCAIHLLTQLTMSVKLLKQSTNSGAYDSEKKQR